MLTAQKRQPRVHVSPISMMVAVAATAGRVEGSEMDVGDGRSTCGSWVRGELVPHCY